MRIKSIKTRNYRVLKDTLVEFGTGYCTISGKNNAGKSGIISLLSSLLYQETIRLWQTSQFELDYKEDKTQWIEDDLPIEITYLIVLSRSDDSALLSFLEQMANKKFTADIIDLDIMVTAKSTGEVRYKITVDNKAVEDKLAKDIIQKLKTSHLMFLHNSTSHDELFYGHGSQLSLVEFVLSEEEKRQILDAESSVQKRIKKFAKQHKEELQSLIGKLEEKYSVEFSTIDANYARHIPLGVRLIDKDVNVPINEWGSGTKNKVYILLSILWANRIKTQAKPDEKNTPIVVIEEPESFLHPSAQAEFGRLLSSLATEFGIQIIVTTHSPYMLNRSEISSNLLVKRKEKNQRKLGSEIVVPCGDEWMVPFSEHLGISAVEFKSWAPIFCGTSKRVLLVEGEIDKGYIEHIQKKKLTKLLLDDDIEIVPYGGKDALKNTLLLKFTLSKYDRVFITFDLDALNDVKRSLESLGYEHSKSYLPIGLDKNGHKDIEGYLPERIRSKVYSANTSLVTEAIGGDRDAKNKLKKKYLEAFTSNVDYSEDEMKYFNEMNKIISKNLSANKSLHRM